MSPKATSIELWFWLELRHCCFMTPVSAGWVNSVCQAAFMLEMALQALSFSTLVPLLFPYMVKFRGDVSENILSLNCVLSSYVITNYPAFIFSFKLLQTNHLTQTDTKKANTLKSTLWLFFWNGWLGFLIQHMDTKLWWHFASQVSLLFKPKERKGNWHWWRGEIVWWQLDEANTLFWSEGSKAWPAPCTDMQGKVHIHVHMQTHTARCSD